MSGSEFELPRNWFDRAVEIIRSSSGRPLDVEKLFNPPPTKKNRREYQPTKAQLTNTPLLSPKIRGSESQESTIYVDFSNADLNLSGFHVPYVAMLHAFSNMYVRYKFGLAFNHVAEGGFIGKDFEARNLGRGSLSIIVNRTAHDMRFASTERDKKLVSILHRVQEMDYLDAQQRPEVKTQDADSGEVLSTWISVMTTLLRYDWLKEGKATSYSRNKAFAKLQDLALNIMPEDELRSFLSFAREEMALIRSY